MKKITVILTIFLLFSFQKFQAQCPTGDVSFFAQSDLDTFVVNYPNCTQLPGKLLIRGCNDLSGLSQITSIADDLIITNNDALQSLNGLNALTTAGDWVEIKYNHALTDLSGLDQLTSISGSLTILDNDALTGLEGLDQLATIEGSCKISRHDNLTNLDDLNGLQSIGGVLEIRQNNGLVTVSGFNQLDTIFGVLNFYDNNALTTVSGFSQLQHIDRLSLNFNDVLSNLNLNQVKTIAGSINVGTHQALTNVDLGELTTVSEFIVFSGFYNSLTNLNLSKLITANSITLRGMNALSTLDFQELTSVNGALTIESNSLATLNTPKIMNLGGLSIEDTQLSDLYNFDHDMSISGNLTLKDNNILSICNVIGICNYLETSGIGSANISNNADGCNAAAGIYVGCSLLPVELTAFNVEAQERNILLSWQTVSEINNQGFEIQRSKDGTNWQKIGWEDGKGISTTLQNYQYTDNTPVLGNNYYRLKQIDIDGSFTYSKVVNAKYGNDIDTDISILPIPAKDVLTLQFHTQQTNSIYIQISNVMGRVIHETSETTNSGLHTRTFNIANFPRGTYFLSLDTGQHVQTKRFVKR